MSIKALAVSTVLVAAGISMSTVGASANDWTGLYIGVNAGAGQDSLNWKNLVVPSEPDAGLPGSTVISPSSGSFLGGAQIGYNWQGGVWVYGLEADFDWMGFDPNDGCLGGYGDYHATCKTHSSWKTDLTARIGGTIGPALLYVKAGGVFMDQSTSAENVEEEGSDAGSYKRTSNAPFGFVFGVGAELAFTDTVSGAIEYDYTDVSKTQSLSPQSSADTEYVIPFHVNVKQQANTVTARLNFKVW